MRQNGPKNDKNHRQSGFGGLSFGADEAWALTEKKQENDAPVQTEDATYTRREALAAMARYSAAIGGAATTIVSADDAVAQASAYGSDNGNWWDDWDWRDWWNWWSDRRGWGNRGGRGRDGRRDRIRF